MKHLTLVFLLSVFVYGAYHFVDKQDFKRFMRNFALHAWGLFLLVAVLFAFVYLAVNFGSVSIL